MPPTPDREPLSWQQEGRLRRDLERGERVRNIVTVLPLPEDIDDGLVLARLREVVQREEAQRIVELQPVDGGYLRYADHIDLPLERIDLASGEELDLLAEQRSYHQFPRHGGPLWNMALTTLPDARGKRTWVLCAAFDHIIFDGLSQALFTADMLAPPPDADRLAGRHREWVRWQRGAYPSSGPGGGDAYEFWSRNLDGTPPDRAADLSFCIDPNGELSGTVQSMRRVVAVSASQIRRAAARVRSTPFLLFLGAATHTVNRFGGSRDMTFRVNTSGRPPQYLDTYGYFADNTAVRVRGQRLSDINAAVIAARDAWFATMPHQMAPWDYLLRAFGGSADTVTRRPAQVLVNFLPWSQAGPPPATAPSEYQTFMGTFQIVGMMWDDDTCMIECEFDSKRFDFEGAVSFLDTLCATFELLARS